MERGKLKLKHHYKDGLKGAISVYVELADGTVWLSKREIAAFFRVSLQAVNVNMSLVFKNGDVNDCELTYYKDGVMYYNLDMVIALAFRMKGGYCRHFREWITRQVVKSFTASERVPIYISMEHSAYIDN
ncbi:MAG: hypothetical protein SNF92_09250 [Rikenellaceae bacterium]